MQGSLKFTCTNVAKRRLLGRLHSNLAIWSSVKSARVSAMPRARLIKNSESRQWESSFARVTTGLRVKGPPANQLPKQRPKLIFPSSSAMVSVARACERNGKRRTGGSCPLMYDGVWWKIDYHLHTREYTRVGINRAKGRRISRRLSEMSLNIGVRDFSIYILQILKFVIKCKEEKII